MAAVVVYPLMKLRAALIPKKDAATAGVVGAIDKNPANVSALAPRRELLIICFPGKANGLADILAASFKYATMDPVNVMPP